MVVIEKTIRSKKEFIELIETSDKTIVFKFSADWCGPCKTIKPEVDFFKESITDNEKILWFDIDVDQSMEVFGMLKTKRIVSGVPAILVYFDENDTIYPDEFVLSSNKKDLEYLFAKIMEVSK